MSNRYLLRAGTLFVDALTFVGIEGSDDDCSSQSIELVVVRFVIDESECLRLLTDVLERRDWFEVTLLVVDVSWWIITGTIC